MAALYERSRETVHLGVLRNSEVVLLGRLHGRRTTPTRCAPLPRPLQRHGQSPARPRPRRHRRPPHPRIDRQHTSQHRLATSGPRRTPAYPRHRHRDSRPGSTSQPQLRRRGTPRRRPPARGRAVHQRADPALRHRTQHDTPSHRVRTMVLTCR
jgi:hypothetical protein